MARNQDKNQATEEELMRQLEAEQASTGAGAATPTAPGLGLLSGKTARDLVGYLLSTGTTHERLRPFDDQVQTGDIETAENLYRAMDAAKVKLGTLRRAGKWIWGSVFEPEEVSKQAPADQLVALQQEVALLHEKLRMANAQKLIAANENIYLREANTDLTRQLAMHRANRATEPALAMV